MASPTLKLILNNWRGDPTKDKDIELPFDVENLCREIDPMINALDSARWLLADKGLDLGPEYEAIVNALAPVDKTGDGL